MQIIAKLIQMLPPQTGTSRNGEWKKQDVIVEVPGQYPKKVCVSIWGDKINSSILEIGNDLVIDCDIESREFNGRWYTDVKAWKIALADGVPSPGLPPVPMNDDVPIGNAPLDPGYLANTNDDLPF